MAEDVLPPAKVTPVKLHRQWQRWAPLAAAAVSATLGVAVGIGALAGQRRFAGLPGVAVVLLGGAITALATIRPWGLRLPRRLVTSSVWTVAGLCLSGSCWLLLDICQLALQSTVIDRDGHSDWLPFGERLGLTLAGALFVATVPAWRRTVPCAHCGRVHLVATSAARPAEPRPPSRRVLWIAYAGCFAWLPYAGLHTLGALGVPGIEPDGYEPRTDAAIAFWLAIGQSIFLLLGLVSPWGQIFPRWVPPLTGRRVPRFLPIVPVRLIAPTFVLYGLGSGVYVLLLAFGVVTWHGDVGDVGLIGVAQRSRSRVTAWRWPSPPSPTSCAPSPLRPLWRPAPSRWRRERGVAAPRRRSHAESCGAPRRRPWQARRGWQARTGPARHRGAAADRSIRSGTDFRRTPGSRARLK